MRAVKPTLGPQGETILPDFESWRSQRAKDVPDPASAGTAQTRSRLHSTRLPPSGLPGRKTAPAFPHTSDEVLSSSPLDTQIQAGIVPVGMPHPSTDALIGRCPVPAATRLLRRPAAEKKNPPGRAAGGFSASAFRSRTPEGGFAMPSPHGSIGCVCGRQSPKTGPPHATENFRRGDSIDLHHGFVANSLHLRIPHLG